MESIRTSNTQARSQDQARQRAAAGLSPHPPRGWLAAHYTVARLGCREAIAFIRAHHYTGSCQAQPWPTYGLYAGQRLIGVCAFACPCSEAVRRSIFGPGHEAEIVELHRFFVIDGTPANIESWMLARCLRLLRTDRPETRAVCAFSDPTPPLCHRGTIYQAGNALAYGLSDRRRFYRDPAGHLRHPRQRGHNITLAEAAARGWTAEWRAGKYRYLFLLGTRAERTAARRRLRVGLTSYPPAVPGPTLGQRLAAFAGWWGLPCPSWPPGPWHPAAPRPWPPLPIRPGRHTLPHSPARP